MLFKKKHGVIKPNLIEKLYNEHNDRLYWVAFKILNDKHLAEDVVQETFERLINNLHLLNPENPDKTAALLTVICKHLAIDVIRKQKNEQITELSEKDTTFSESTYNPEKLLISKESYETVLHIIDNMDIKYKSVLLLSCGHKLSVEAISNLLKIPFETAKKRLFRARKAVKEELIKLKQTEDNITDEIL